MKILIVDDEREALVSLKRLLKRKGFTNVEICDKGTEAISLIKNNNYDLVLLDLLMPDIHGIEVLKQTKPFTPQTEIIILTAVDEVEMAVSAVKLGAYDYLVKPVQPEKIFISIDRAYERRGLITSLNTYSSKVSAKNINDEYSEIITQCPKMHELLNYAEIMVKSGNPILITGESGTGKELLAKAIHKIVNENEKKFIPINVASIPENLFESLFFGHVKGSFTGAETDAIGYFKQADGGTLFLDEVGELPLQQQTKFLRVLEDNLITPVGQNFAEKINFRIISATNKDIEDDCRQGTFRLDLLYRLKSIHIELPPLRDRKGDVEYLTNYFVNHFSEKHKRNILSIDSLVLQYLVQKEYPGNIRELRQEVENAVLICQEEALSIHHFINADKNRLQPDSTNYGTLKEHSDLYFLDVLKHFNWDKKKSAVTLGITLRQVQRKLAELKENPIYEPIIGDN